MTNNYENIERQAPVVGDILTASWGYDATFIDYYKVIKVTNSQVTVIQLNTVIDSVQDVCSVLTVVGEIKEGAEPLRRKIQPRGYGGYSIKINSYKYATLWDGQPKRQTASGWY